MGRGNNSNLLYGSHLRDQDQSFEKISGLLDIKGAPAPEDWFKNCSKILNQVDLILLENSELYLSDTKQNRLIISKMLQQFFDFKLYWLSAMSDAEDDRMFSHSGNYANSEKKWRQISKIFAFLQTHQYLIEDSKLYQQILEKQMYYIVDSLVPPFRNLSNNLLTIIQNDNNVLRQPATIVFADGLDYHYRDRQSDNKLLCGLRLDLTNDKFRFGDKADHVFRNARNTNTECQGCSQALKKNEKCQTHTVRSKQYLNYLLAQTASQLSKHDPKEVVQDGFAYQAQFIAEKVSKQFAQAKLADESINQEEAEDLELHLPEQIVLDDPELVATHIGMFSTSKIKFLTQADIQIINESYPKN